MAMELPRMSKSVVRVISIQEDASGAPRPITLYDKGDVRAKKQHAALKPLGKAVTRLENARLQFAKAYTKRHKKSNTKRRDGWARDLPLNLLTASYKARRKLKVL